MEKRFCEICKQEATKVKNYNTMVKNLKTGKRILKYSIEVDIYFCDKCWESRN